MKHISELRWNEYSRKTYHASTTLMEAIENAQKQAALFDELYEFANSNDTKVAEILFTDEDGVAPNPVTPEQITMATDLRLAYEVMKDVSGTVNDNTGPAVARRKTMRRMGA